MNEASIYELKVKSSREYGLRSRLHVTLDQSKDEYVKSAYHF